MCEAVKISRKRNDENLNSKCEYNAQRLRKFEVQKDKYHEYDCKICGHRFDNVNEVKIHDKMFHMKITCEHCLHTVFGETSLKYHMMNSHNC